MKPEIFDMFIKIGLAGGALFTGVITFFMTYKRKKKVNKLLEPHMITVLKY